MGSVYYPSPSMKGTSRPAPALLVLGVYSVSTHVILQPIPESWAKFQSPKPPHSLKRAEGDIRLIWGPPYVNISPRLGLPWENFGLHKDRSGTVGLKKPPIHGALIFANPGTSRETWKLMETLDGGAEFSLGFATRMF
ncbi:hypothetical protein EDD22DRAFT_848336 [Suillus occidentalis]|nr:hypothetical protein EDD22DRAFT_848336 [Suillus occidentalis]